MQLNQIPPIPPIPDIPWWLGVGDLIPIVGIIGGVFMLALLIWPLMKWLQYKHELAKAQLPPQDIVHNPKDLAKINKLEERLENLETLICRLDQEMNFQLEKSLTGGRLSMLNPDGDVSQMPTAFMNMVSALEGRYQILRELGRGGMGIVFQAHDKQLNEQVALKVISPVFSNDSEALERLKREVSSARRISHTNIIRIFDIGENNGLHFVSMEFFPGANLKEYVRKNGALSLMQAQVIVQQICDGLTAAHSQGIIHRDLKTQNIIISPTNHIKIIDFGLARCNYMEGMTATGLIMGTPEYMSPEQVSGKKVDERTDIYALGVILYELLTGRVPFKGDSAIAVGFKQMKEDPPDPRTMNPHISQEMCDVILKALQKDPSHRYRSVQEMRNQFETALNQSAAAGSLSDKPPMIAPEVQPER